MSEEDRKVTLLSLLAGFALGALVGAVAALLLAPRSGDETRTQIRDTADDLLEKLRDNVAELRGKVDEMVASVSSRAYKAAIPQQGDFDPGELGGDPIKPPG